jgi:maltose alpha-D-glucosyltransferase/alpha-amylase
VDAALRDDRSEHWYKDVVFSQLHVKSFVDSDADGIGDFKGLHATLDNVVDLGVDCLWPLPMHPSPFRDDGYDIADYCSIHPTCGRLQDFRNLLDAAHARAIRVITELVLNHTSDQQPWFKEARCSADSPRRDWPVSSDRDDRGQDAPVVFLDTERSNWAWDPESKAFDWHRVFTHRPDL